MEENTLILVSGYNSVSPKPSRRAYLNLSEEQARQRFLSIFPNCRDIKIVAVPFTDELIIQANGDITAR
ncbi:hypothetical protein [Arsenicibacter rosenii]|uniref:Uncharacterized protein n=1 Tax=Arsenicibacter rosenii TaxID=1750698 RepID=A0A1S2VTR9_9BACT|nr:hypothetical protein [Arsenicibacter rosenii]OIN61298.1 hypothetical protein BLX24_02910 [Arsenicibacter rosenii]